jgi:histidine ammonia-lyase
MPIVLDGSSLTIEKLAAIARFHEKVELVPALARHTKNNRE